MWEHVQRGSNCELPAVNTDLKRRRKHGGELFADDEEEFQIASQANRIQMWWNTWSSKKHRHLRRRDVFDVFGKIVHKLTLIQPSSAASERVFSILVHMYGKQQVSCLEDYKEAGVMMCYNKRKS